MFKFVLATAHFSGSSPTCSKEQSSLSRDNMLTFTPAYRQHCQGPDPETNTAKTFSHDIQLLKNLGLILEISSLFLNVQQENTKSNSDIRARVTSPRLRDYFYESV